MSLEADLERLRLEDSHPLVSRLEKPELPVSRLETLGQELRYEILGYLLYASLVRHPHPRRTDQITPTGTYKFRLLDWQVQILRVSRTFHHDGKHILYQGNKWVKLQAQLDPYMASDVPLIAINSAFEENVKPLMEITLKVVPFELHISRKMTSCMLLVDDVVRLCNCLRIVRYSSNAIFTYDIFIPTKVAKSLQRRLPHPFAVLREDSIVQTVNI